MQLHLVATVVANILVKEESLGHDEHVQNGEHFQQHTRFLVYWT